MGEENKRRRLMALEVSRNLINTREAAATMPRNPGWGQHLVLPGRDTHEHKTWFWKRFSILEKKSEAMNPCKEWCGRCSTFAQLLQAPGNINILRHILSHFAAIASDWWPVLFCGDFKESEGDTDFGRTSSEVTTFPTSLALRITISLLSQKFDF